MKSDKNVGNRFTRPAGRFARVVVIILLFVVGTIITIQFGIYVLASVLGVAAVLALILEFVQIWIVMPRRARRHIPSPEDHRDFEEHSEKVLQKMQERKRIRMQEEQEAQKLSGRAVAIRLAIAYGFLVALGVLAYVLGAVLDSYPFLVVSTVTLGFTLVLYTSAILKRLQKPQTGNESWSG